MDSLQQFLSDSLEYSDVTTIVKLFDNAYLLNFRDGESKQDYYCGITKDLEQRRVQHKIEKFIKHLKCTSFEIACSVEEELHKRGYDTGKQTGNGVDDSRYVYMYRKTLTSKE